MKYEAVNEISKETPSFTSVDLCIKVLLGANIGYQKVATNSSTEEKFTF
jgi:hypothetical protein